MRPSLVAALVGASAALRAPFVAPDTRPKVYVLNDVASFTSPTNSDPDNLQFLPGMCLYANTFHIVGIGCTYPLANVSLKTTTQTWLTNVYGADYPQLVSVDPLYPSPDELVALVKQGRTTTAPAAGYTTATELSNHLIEQIHAYGTLSEPLWVLVLGGGTDLAQAMHDDPTIAGKFRVYATAWATDRFNYYVDADAAAYIESLMVPGQPFDDTLFIANGQTYYGFYRNGDPFDADREFMWRHVAGHGAMGDFLVDTCMNSSPSPSEPRQGFSMGDLCGYMYILDNDLARGNGLDPTQAGWGGRYALKSNKGNRYYGDVTGEIVNGHPGANTIAIWRDDIMAEVATRFHALCEVPPVIFAIESFQDVVGDIADIGGRAASPGPGVWRNFRTGDVFPGKVTLLGNSQAYATSQSATSAIYVLDGASGPSDANSEVEIIYQDTNASLTGGGPIVGADGDTTTGQRYEHYKYSSSQHTLVKQIDGTATNYLVNQNPTFPVVNNAYIRFRIRRQNNGDGTVTVTVWGRNAFTNGNASSWVLINSFIDEDPFLEGGVPGFRTTQTGRVYGLVYRSIPNTVVPVTAPFPPVLTATPSNGQVEIAYVDGYNGGQPINGRPLHRDTTEDFAPSGGNLIATVTAASPYIDTDVVNDTTYYYKMAATNSLGTGDFSAEVEATPAVYIEDFPLSGALLDINPDNPTLLTISDTDKVDEIDPANGATYGATSTGSLRPQYIVDGDGHGILRFAGAQEMIANAALAAALDDGAAHAFIAVVKLNATATSSVIFDAGKAASGSLNDRSQMIAVGTQNWRHRKANASAGTDANGATLASTSTGYHLIMCRTTAGSSTASVVVDNTAGADGSAITTSAGWDSATIGNRKSSAGNLYAQIDLARLVVLPTTLTGTPLNQVRAWAQAKYGTP